MKQKRKTLKKKQKNNVLPNKVFIPKTNQEIISYMFKEVDERTGIFRIDEDTYSICIEYSDVSFAKANDEEAENIFFKWLEYLHSFREDTHIQVINAGTPIKTEKYKEKGINKTVRAMIAGIPNVGKSAILNRLSGTRKMQVLLSKRKNIKKSLYLKKSI